MGRETTSSSNSSGDLLLAAWRYWLLLVWCVSWGGLTFYALVVVPIGTDLFGSVEQGFVTQRVTQWHNGLSIVLAATLLVEAIRCRTRWIWLMTILQSVVAALLCVQHSRLTAVMDFASKTVPADFYAMHASYLWLVAIQWFSGLLVPLLFWNDRFLECQR